MTQYVYVILWKLDGRKGVEKVFTKLEDAEKFVEVRNKLLEKSIPIPCFEIVITEIL